MDILELANRFEKLAQVQPMPAGTSNPAALPAGAYTGPGGEVTIVGDPNDQNAGKAAPAPAASSVAEQVMQQAGWKNFKVHSYYYPPNPDDRKLLETKGFKEMMLPDPIAPGGQARVMVPPNEISFVTQALAKGYKYAGPGFGLLPAQWFDWLRKNRYI